MAVRRSGSGIRSRWTAGPVGADRSRLVYIMAVTPDSEWADGLSPQKRAAFAAAVRLVLARRGLDVVETEDGKALGDGLYEVRVRLTASEIRHQVEVLAPWG